MATTHDDTAKVLHTIGNQLTAVVVAAGSVRELCTDRPVGLRLQRFVEWLESSEDPAFLASQTGEKVVSYLRKLADAEVKREEMLKEDLQSLQRGLDQACRSLEEYRR